jgi:hypothetical protein
MDYVPPLVPIISRSRKIRCDSTRPVCNNCARRSNECEYDLVPKRRGPDKRPGTRQRSCKKRPADGSTPPRAKRKRTSTDQITEPQDIPPPSRVKENLQDSKRSSPVDRYTQDSHLSHPHSVSPDVRIQSDTTTHYKVCMLFLITSLRLNKSSARDIFSISSDTFLSIRARFLHQIILSSATGRKYHSIFRH